MNAHALFRDAHVVHLRELKAELQRLHAELDRAHAENDSLRSHFALALAAARDADRLPPEGRLLIVDGWNALLGSASILPPAERHAETSRKRALLVDAVRAWLAVHPLDRAWIVFDGPQPHGEEQDRLRITFTGGEGPHRADRFVCDYLRMRRLTGAAQRLLVLTEDADFRRNATALGADVASVQLLRPDAPRDS